ncbi:hypothetical protein BDV26DRAFT_118309 [Aspergillus bertholletiae]|uniref:Uncharacterized protein n=1 Tax=Aspergillus bertholletiae TaxID=1226010 RepID=A0A5N7BG61_9EURO|nr:hypothetical protein BDV26DRAFT_118309 [Aspergillus bertholletiae]
MPFPPTPRYRASQSSPRYDPPTFAPPHPLQYTNQSHDPNSDPENLIDPIRPESRTTHPRVDIKRCPGRVSPSWTERGIVSRYGYGLVMVTMSSLKRYCLKRELRSISEAVFSRLEGIIYIKPPLLFT